MGLKKTITILDDVTVTDAYFRITAVHINYDSQRITLTLGCWKSRAACKNGKQQIPAVIEKASDHTKGSPMAISYFPHALLAIPDGSDVGAKSQQYSLLKSGVPFFTDAADALE